MSAVLASVITAGAVGVGGYYFLKDNAAPAIVESQSGSIESGASTLVSYNGKNVMTVNEIAKKLGPSCVGIINKAKVQPQKYYDPFSGRYYYYQKALAQALS